MVFHPAYHDVGRVFWDSGVLAVLEARILAEEGADQANVAMALGLLVMVVLVALA